MTITLHGVANNGGNDDATYAHDRTAAPLSTAQSGDLLFMVGHAADPGGALTIPTGNDSGQTWNSLGSDDQTRLGIVSRFHVWWAEFDGNWNGEDPGVNIPAQGGNNAGQSTLQIYRDSVGGAWSVDVAIAWTTDDSVPWTITGPTPTTSDPTVSLGIWGSPIASSFNSLSGTGWSQAGSSSGYVVNVGGNDDSANIFAYATAESTSTLADVSHSGGSQAHLGVVVFTATPAAVPEWAKQEGQKDPLFLPPECIGFANEKYHRRPSGLYAR